MLKYNLDTFLAQRLVNMGIITDSQLQDCLKEQEEKEKYIPLAFFLIEKGYLNDKKLEDLIRHERDYFSK